MTNNTVPRQTEIGDTEFTLRLSSDAEMKFRRIEHAHHFSENPDHPAENMTWHQATDFCRWLADTHGNVWEWRLEGRDAAGYRRRWEEITDRDTYELNEKFGDRDKNSHRVLRVGSVGIAAIWC